MFGRQKNPETSFFIMHRRVVLWGLGGIVALLLSIRVFTLMNISGGARARKAFYLIYPFDRTLATSLETFQELVEGSTQGEQGSGIERLDRLLGPFIQEPKGVMGHFSKAFPEHWNLFHGLTQHKNDMYSLLGFEKPQTYLVILQNSAEKRPNGGFFGSFAVVTVDQGRVIDVQLEDSYHPEWNRPDTVITGPEWLEEFIPDRAIAFVGANKIGFTYHDGANIKTLYEKSYPGKPIRGVIFLRTDMLEALLPEMREQFWHWQWLNATVDLRRGEERRGKKEAYVAGVKEFVNERKKLLLESIFTQLPELIKQRYINVYLEKISGPMHTWLRTVGLTTRFEDKHAYFRDSNIVFNKIDRFIEKTILIDNDQTFLSEGDIINVSTLRPGLHQFVINYTLNVPDTYHAFIRKLNQENNLLLGQREEHILGLDHERGTRGNIYFPPNRQIVSIQGDNETQRTFSTPFSSNAAYEMRMPPGSNGTTKQVTIQVMVE